MPGAAAFSGPKSVTVRDLEGGEERITAAHVILATGAAPDYGPNLRVDGRSVLSTDQALNIETIPQTLVVVGAGARGVEFASIYHQLGARVALIEKKKHILSAVDQPLADRYKKALLDRRIKVLTRTELVEAHPREEGGVILVMASGEEKREIKADLVILTGERRPVYGDLNLGRAGLAPVEGVLEADADMRTKADGVYVVGDAAGPPYLAHKAIAQGLGAVDHILGRPGRKRPLAVPFCLYGSPEAASVGLSEEEAEDSGRRVKVGEYLFAGNGRAGALGDLEGGGDHSLGRRHGRGAGRPDARSRQHRAYLAGLPGHAKRSGRGGDQANGVPPPGPGRVFFRGGPGHRRRGRPHAFGRGMSREVKPPDQAPAREPELLGLAQEIGRRIGLEFQRLILHQDRRIEMEFEGPNPWECLVMKADDWSQLRAALESGQSGLRLPQPPVIRNRCEKCMVQERQAEEREPGR